MFKPNSAMLFFAAVLIGGLFAAALIWLFGIQISSYDRLSEFPEKWTVLEFIWNATAIMIIAGAIRGVYVALYAHYYGDPDDGPPNPRQVGDP